MVIDGHHRVAKAIREGVGLGGYILSKEQTAQVKDAVENPRSRIAPKPTPSDLLAQAQEAARINNIPELAETTTISEAL